VTGTLNFSQASALNPVKIVLHSRGTNGLPGVPAHFDQSVAASWVIASSTGGVVGFTSGAATVDATAFLASFDGNFSVAQSGTDLVLVYTPNRPPVTQADALQRESGSVGKFAGSLLLANDSDPDPGNTLALVDEDLVSANGVPISIREGWVFYNIVDVNSTAADSFVYHVRDQKGAQAAGTVTVTVRDKVVPPANAAIVSVTAASPTSYRNLTVRISAPSGRNYYVYGRDQLLTGDWIRLNGGAALTSSRGAITFVDPNRGNSPTRYYRTEVVP
jgi:hypothetical protein